MTRPSELSPNVAKVLSLLELLIAAKKIGTREFERRLKMSYGTVARIFSGKITLKFQTVLDMLEVLEVPAQGFFASVLSSDDAGIPTGAEDLLRRVKKLTIPEPPEREIFRAEIKQMIEEILTERLTPEATDEDGDPGEASPSSPSDSASAPAPERSRRTTPRPSGRRPKPPV
jgi:transcriptional regulator with XRE-family HTH domain